LIFFTTFFIILENMIRNYFDFLHVKLNCKKFIDTNIYQDRPFSELAKLLYNKDLLNNTKKFLKIFINENNICVKKFLTCFMIKHHPNVIISKNTDIEKDMLECSNKLIEFVHDMLICKNKFSLNFYISRFKLYYSKYIYLFGVWKEYDKYKILNDLSTIYFELEQDKLKKYDEIDSLSNHEFIVSIEREQKKLVEKIEQIAGKEGLEYLDKLKTEIDDYKKNIENLYTSINENLHESFWNSFELELTKDPPNMSVIIARLEEIKMMLLDCDNTLEEELNNNIDVPFIAEMLERGVIDDKYIHNMCNYIVSVVKRCNSESQEVTLEEFREGMNEQLQGGVMYREFFPIFFRYLFENIDDIKKRKEIYNLLRENIEN